MNRCSECKHFYQEFDTNYAECRKEVDEGDEEDCELFEDATENINWGDE